MTFLSNENIVTQIYPRGQTHGLFVKGALGCVFLIKNIYFEVINSSYFWNNVKSHTRMIPLILEPLHMETHLAVNANI